MWKFFLLFPLVALAVPAVSGSRTVGGWNDANIDDAAVVAAAKHCAMSLSDGPFLYRIHEIVMAKQQVVAGTNYRLEMIIGQTNCKKDELKCNQDLADCEFQDGKDTYKHCEATVYVNLKGEQKLEKFCCSVYENDD